MTDGAASGTMTRAGAVALSDTLASLSSVEQWLYRGLSTALGEAGLSVEQWRLLNLVKALEAPTMGELAAASALPGASLSRTVDALEDDASVFRLVDQDDRRRITVRLSDRGASRLAVAQEIVAAWDANLRRVLGADVVGRLSELTATMAERLTER